MRINAIAPKQSSQSQVLTTKTVSCDDCNDELITLMMTDESQATNTITVCCDCGFISFEYDLFGRLKASPSSGIQIEDIQTTVDNDHYKIIIKVRHE